MLTSETLGSLQRSRWHKTKNLLCTLMPGPQTHSKGTAHFQKHIIITILIHKLVTSCYATAATLAIDSNIKKIAMTCTAAQKGLQDRVAQM